MINDAVIKEIYKKFNKPHKNLEDLRLDYYIPMLNKHHSIVNDGFEIEIQDLEESNFFRRFLVRSLNAVLEFDKMIAFVFRSHILFLAKDDNQLRVHFKPEPEKKPSLLRRLFGRN